MQRSLDSICFLMEKEFKYVAPEAEVLSAQVERGVYSSDITPGTPPNIGEY